MTPKERIEQLEEENLKLKKRVAKLKRHRAQAERAELETLRENVKLEREVNRLKQPKSLYPNPWTQIIGGGTTTGTTPTTWRYTVNT